MPTGARRIETTSQDNAALSVGVLMHAEEEEVATTAGAIPEASAPRRTSATIKVMH
jgi:hypothetical protein